MRVLNVLLFLLLYLNRYTSATRPIDVRYNYTENSIKIWWIESIIFEKFELNYTTNKNDLKISIHQQNVSNYDLKGLIPGTNYIISIFAQTNNFTNSYETYFEISTRNSPLASDVL